MGIVSQDTFAGRTVAASFGTASDGEPWAAVRNTPVWSVAAGEGLFAAVASFTIARLGSQSLATQMLLTRLKPGDTINNIGLVGRFVTLDNFYYGVFVGGNLLIGKDVAGSFTTLGSTGVTYTAVNFFWLRFLLQGTSLQLKSWQDGTAEPAAYQVSVTDSSLVSGGWGVGSDSTLATSYDSFSVSDTRTSIGDGLGGVFS